MQSFGRRHRPNIKQNKFIPSKWIFEHKIVNLLIKELNVSFENYFLKLNLILLNKCKICI